MADDLTENEDLLEIQVLEGEYKEPLTSLLEPSFSNNTDFIHAGAEDCWGG